MVTWEVVVAGGGMSSRGAAAQSLVLGMKASASGDLQTRSFNKFVWISNSPRFPDLDTAGNRPARQTQFDSKELSSLFSQMNQFTESHVPVAQKPPPWIAVQKR